MKRALSLLAFSAIAAVAGPLKVGGDVSGLLNIPSFDPSTDLSSKIGFGGKIAPAVEYSVNDKFSIRGNLGYEYSTFGVSESDPYLGSATVNFTTQYLTIDLAAQYAVIPQAFVALGFGYDVALSAKDKFEGVESDLTGKKNPFLLNIGLGYKVTPDVAITLGYSFPLTSLDEEDNGDGSTDKITAQKVSIGARYDFGI